MRSIIDRLLIALLSVIMVGASAQDKAKIWTDWSMKDVENVLDYSPWGQTIVSTDLPNVPLSGKDLGVRFHPNADIRVRFVSAKPIRQALLRMMELNPSKYLPEEIAKAREFANLKYDRTIVVGLGEGRFPGSGSESFLSLYRDLMASRDLSANLKSIYLEVKGGKRVSLQEYQPPTQDGLGMKLVFPRFIDGRPVIDPQAGEVRFHALFLNLNINIRFKISDFMYNGVLEY